METTARWSEVRLSADFLGVESSGGGVQRSANSLPCSSEPRGAPSMSTADDRPRTGVGAGENSGAK
eukprot:scaffold97677_cov29-Tisochrysis_lutea.AAC.3